jgi:hypothetical protein
LVLGAENFFREPMPVLGRVFSFLGIPAWEGDPTMQRWVAKKYSYDRYAPMDEAVRRQLMEYYRPHNERLYRLAGENFGWDSAAG